MLADGYTVVGIDNLNDAYDVRLKHWRLGQLEGQPGFEFHRLDITNRRELWELKGQRLALSGVEGWALASTPS